MQFLIAVRMGEKMKVEQFEQKLRVNGGQFYFSTNKHEGMIGVSPSKVLIWVDAIGFSEGGGESIPRNVGEYECVDELLKVFFVDGEKFVDSILPKIESLSKIFCA